MAYLAFYRTFRPTTFDTVVRQEHIVKILKNQIVGDKIGHAYLFCGPRGTGKTTLARIFAKAINCENPKDGSPCGECPACKALSSGSALDICEIDAASNNGVDEMRDLREKVQYPPVNGKYKVYIIDEVHMLTSSAFNAVLKTLEEPPRHAVFILATTEPQKLPATILSRCMRFDFKLIPQPDLENLIKEIYRKTGKEFEDEAVAAIARAGNGSVRDCLSIADMCASYSREKLTYDDVNRVLGKADFFAVSEIVAAMLAQDAGGALSLCEGALSTGKGVGVLLRDIMSFLNSLSIVKMCRGAEEIVNLPKDKFDRLRELAGEVDGHAILRAVEIFARTEGDLRYAVDGRITLEAAVVKVAMPQADMDLGALLTRVEALERKLEKGVKVTVEARSAELGARPAETAPAIEETTAPESGGRVKSTPAAKSALESESSASPFDEPPKVNPEGTQGSLFDQGAMPPPTVGSLSDRDKSTLFGRFLRLFRTTRKNAVLFTLCMDLESFFEGETFVLCTPVEAVYKSLCREDNRQYIGEALAELGVFSYDVRLKPKGEDKYRKALNALMDNFGGTDVDIK